MVRTAEQILAEAEANMDEMVAFTRRAIARRAKADKAAKLAEASKALAAYYAGSAGESIMEDYRTGNVKVVFAG